MTEANSSSQDTRALDLTLPAVKAVQDILKEEGEDGDFLRVSVKGGGCSGFQYDLNFDNKVRMGDFIHEFEGFKVVVDSFSAGYLEGTVIDYQSGLNGTGFKFNNPKAKRTCGCGQSWS